MILYVRNDMHQQWVDERNYSMYENEDKMKSDILEKGNKDKNSEMEKMIEEIEQKAFMAGYDYAIEVLKAGRVQKK